MVRFPFSAMRMSAPPAQRKAHPRRSTCSVSRSPAPRRIPVTGVPQLGVASRVGAGARFTVTPLSLSPSAPYFVPPETNVNQRSARFRKKKRERNNQQRTSVPHVRVENGVNTAAVESTCACACACACACVYRCFFRCETLPCRQTSPLRERFQAN